MAKRTPKQSGPLQRIIPAGWQVWNLCMDGQSPLLMNSSEFDRNGATYRAYRQLGAKRGKTIDDELRLQELEFHLALHYDVDLGVFVPGINIKEMLRQSATKWRKGEEVRRSLLVPAYRVPLIYEGPREPAALFEAGSYDVRMVANAGAGSGRVPRCRPAFMPWTVETEIAIDPEDLDPHVVQDAVDRSIKYGFGDGRTIGFGAFTPTFTFLRVQREPSKADPVKTRNGAGEMNLKAATERILA